MDSPATSPKLFSRMSIRKKMILIVMLVTSTVMLLAQGTLIVYEWYSMRQRMVTDLSVLATMVSDNCKGALSFNEPRDATDVLNSLRAIVSIEEAVVFDNTGKRFADFSRAEKANLLAPAFSHDHHEFTKNDLTMGRQIFLADLPIGSLYLRSNLDELYGFFYRRISDIVLLLIMALAVAYMLSTRLQRVISVPLLHLADIAGSISKKRDYSIRAVKHSEDELGLLTDAFNSMLVQVEKRDYALKGSEELLKATQNSTADGILVVDNNGTVLNANRQFMGMWGLTEEQVFPGQNDDRLISYVLDQLAAPDDFRKKVAELYKSSTETLDEIIFKDGRTFERFTCPLIQNGRESGRVWNFRDITERKTLQKQLLQSQKMEAIGTLAGGIAHDFNNILAAIIGYAEIAKEDLPLESPTISDLNEIFKAGLRGRELVNQILTFSRQSEQELKPIQIHLIITEALKLLRSSIPTSIEIRQDIDTRSGTVLSDATRIHQIIINLCTNAYYAMRTTGGVLSIKLRPIQIEEDDYKIKSFDLTPGSYVELAVGDSGIGMDKETMDKIFDPYFTTKEIGEGTGLGLSVVHGIVKSYGGHITVYSEPGKGTTFRIYLPKTDSESDAIDTEAVDIYPTGNERALIIDDEETIVHILERTLVSLGYQVTAMNSSREALKTFQKNPDRFDFIITDMTMPNMNGMELIQRINEFRPDIPAIICTGFSDLIDKEKTSNLGIRKYLMKPVVKKELAFAIREVLADR